VTTFVSLGNATQPFNRLIEAVMKIVAQLPKPVIVQHGSTRFAAVGCIARPFLGMEEYRCLMTESELVILHAGAGSLIHAIQAGKMPVVMPRRVKYGEVIDDHQVELAKALAEAGKVIVAEEPHELLDAIAEALRCQQLRPNSMKHSRMIDLVDSTLRKYEQGLRK